MDSQKWKEEVQRCLVMPPLIFSLWLYLYSMQLWYNIKIRKLTLVHLLILSIFIPSIDWCNQHYIQDYRTIPQNSPLYYPFSHKITPTYPTIPNFWQPCFHLYNLLTLECYTYQHVALWDLLFSLSIIPLIHPTWVGVISLFHLFFFWTVCHGMHVPQCV